MKHPRWLLLFLLTPLLWFAGCVAKDPCADGNYSQECKPDKAYYENRITEAKRSLSSFDGKRAATIFRQVNADHIKFNNKPYCKAVYGVVLADVQIFVENLNGLILRLLTNSAGGGGLAPGYEAAAARPTDFGTLLENGWSSFEPVLIEMSDYARAVTALDDCSFSIGLGDEDEKLKSTDEINPYQFVINIGGPGGPFSPQEAVDAGNQVIKNAPVAQIIFKSRFDGAEARLIDMFARTLLGGADYILAHEYSMTIDPYKIALQLGLPVECVRTDILDCSFEAGIDADLILNNILGWAYLFEENPGLLAKSETRWDRRMNFADNEFAGAFYTMRTFFQALVTRNENLRKQALSSQALGEYVFLYSDNNENSTVDAFDTLGLRITEVKLNPEFIIDHTNMESTPEGKEAAAKLRKSFSSAQDGINGLKSVLEGLTPSEAAVGEVQTFIERGYGNFAAIDNPSIPYERIPISSFNTVIQDFLFALVDAPLPNFMEFDLRQYFTDPKPLRDFVPLWKKTLTGTRSEFIVDSDEYEGWQLGPDGEYLSDVTAVAADKFMRPLEWESNNTLFGAGERGLFSGSYDGGSRGPITGLSLPSDCINATNLSSKLALPGEAPQDSPWRVAYFALPDPTLNGMVWVNLDVWMPTYDNAKNGAACPNDPAGMQTATNYSITKGLWMFLDFTVDHFQLASALGLF